MRRTRVRTWLALPLVLGTAWTVQQAVSKATSPLTLHAAALQQDPTADAVAAANAFLATLNDTQRANVSFAFDSDQKTKWSNLPTGLYQRNGLRMGDLTEAQRSAGMALLAAVLSPEGYQKVVGIVNAEEVLKNSGGGLGGGGVKFGSDEYYIALLGTPSATDPWIVQFGGHHLAINVTIVGANNGQTPTHTGVQPATYTLNGATIRPLGDENDKSFALINSLDAAQQAQAILDSKVSNLVLGPGAADQTIQPEGIKGSALNADQQARLFDLAGEWINIINEGAAAQKRAEVQANLADTYFAWSGATTNGSTVYYRIQGPTLWIEFAHQGNTEHIHTIYRDLTNEYGKKWISP